MLLNMVNNLRTRVIKVSKPTLVPQDITFDNRAHSVSVEGFDPDAMLQEGIETATKAGTYQVTYRPKDGYCWYDGTSTAVTYSWIIKTRALSKPTYVSGDATYDGNLHEVVVSAYDSNYVDVSGDTSSINAGTYTSKYSLKYPDSTKWSDGTTADVLITLKIEKLTVIRVTYGSGAFTYNGQTQTLQVNNYNANYIDVSGTTSAVNAGNYVATYSLKSKANTKWDDNTTNDIQINWNIAKISVGIPYLTNANQAYVDGQSKTVTVNGADYNMLTQSGTVTASNTGVYTVSWALKDSVNTQWNDGTSNMKHATWSISWINGQSHYANDIYNRGWLAPGWRLVTERPGLVYRETDPRTNVFAYIYEDHIRFSLPNANAVSFLVKSNSIVPSDINTAEGLLGGNVAYECKFESSLPPQNGYFYTCYGVNRREYRTRKMYCKYWRSANPPQYYPEDVINTFYSSTTIEVSNNSSNTELTVGDYDIFVRAVFPSTSDYDAGRTDGQTIYRVFYY